jgi:beta-lactam-binding protein with PASTA domain
VNFNNYDITNDVHHLPVAYFLTVPVASVCGGSRTFRVGVDVYWSRGNPVKIDGGVVDVINYTRSTTATVPNVLGTNVLHAESALREQGFKPSVEDRVVNPASRGTVLDENPPGDTVAPTGSEVLLGVSLGRAIVPNVSGEPEAKARHLIAAAGLVASVSHPQTCIDPGLVSQQSPAGGAAVAPGSEVSLTVTTCKQGDSDK